MKKETTPKETKIYDFDNNNNQNLEGISKKIMEQQSNLETNKLKEIKRIVKLYQDKILEAKDFKILEKKFKFLFGKNDGKRIYENSLKVCF